MNLEFKKIIQLDSENISEPAVETLWAHWQLIQEWNSRINLTSINDSREAAWIHYRDSIEAARYLPEGSTVVDMGSGGGFPGIPLAIVRPDISFELIEPRRKRVSFLRVVVSRLGLQNVKIRMARSVDPIPQAFDVLVTRATFSKDTDLQACLRWVRPGGFLLAFRSGDSPRLSEATRFISYELSNFQRRYDIIDIPSE